MALVHNMLIRALNCIYLQAPHITQPNEEGDFCRYALTWHKFLHIHHTREESSFFPAIEAMAGEDGSGAMDVNVQQHRAFAQGLAELKTYLDSVEAGGEKYDGQRVVDILDSFAPVLVQHLTEEIETLTRLRRFGPEKMRDIRKLMDKEADATVVCASSLGYALPLYMRDADEFTFVWKHEERNGLVRYRLDVVEH